MPTSRRIKNEVNEAFKILLEELQAVERAVKDTAAQALRVSDFVRAERSIECAKQIEAFAEKVAALQKEWARLPLTTLRTREKQRAGAKKQPLPRGLRTPKGAFRKPILEALVELGGSAPASAVLEIVERKMRAHLTRYDYEPLPSQPAAPRWRNAAQWCRLMLVREGLMKRDSPRGIWEVSEEGRAALSSGKV